MNLISLPPEVRAIIYDFSFPSAHTQVQLIPYHASLPACHLNLPLPLYRVCKLIYMELPPLATKLRALDLLYIIHGPSIEFCSIFDDLVLAHFESCLRFAERLRLVGYNSNNSELSDFYFQSELRRLTAGPECAIRVLEVQPGTWGLAELSWALKSCLRNVSLHPDVAARLQVRLIRDGKEEAAEDEEKWAGMEEWLKRYQDQVHNHNKRGRERGRVRFQS